MELKELFNKEEILSEEVTIGRVEKKYIVSVYPEPLKNPTFHIRTKTGDTECIYQIKDFRMLEQKTHNSFSNKELKKVCDWMKQANEHFPDFSNWLILLKFWNIVNPNKKVSLKLEQPEFKMGCVPYGAL